MNKLLLLSISVLLFASCVTEKKVRRYLNEHPTMAAGYCADEFPPDTTARLVEKKPDSSGYNSALDNVLKPTLERLRILDSIQKARQQQTGEVPRYNVDSLRKVIEKEFRKALIPCVDSIEYRTNTVVDRARERQLQGRIDELINTLTSRDKRITELEEKVKSQRKWVWMFWGLIALLGLGVFLKLKKVF